MAEPQEVYLEEDPIKVPGQRYACMSYVSPNVTNQKAEYIGEKIRGCFGTLEEAQKHAERLSKMDKGFDVYIVEMYNWVKVPPNPDDIEDHVHQEKWLNDHEREYKEEHIKAKQHFEERKNEMLQNIKNDNARIEKENKELDEKEKKLLLDENEEDIWLKRKEEEKTNEEKTNGEKTNGEKTNEEKTNGEKTNEEKTNEEKTNEEKTNEEKTNE